MSKDRINMAHRLRIYKPRFAAWSRDNRGLWYDEYVWRVI